MMRQGSVCIDEPVDALNLLRSGKKVYLRLRGSELTRLIRLMETQDDG